MVVVILEVGRGKTAMKVWTEVICLMHKNLIVDGIPLQK